MSVQELLFIKMLRGFVTKTEQFSRLDLDHLLLLGWPHVAPLRLYSSDMDRYKVLKVARKLSKTCCSAVKHFYQFFYGVSVFHTVRGVTLWQPTGTSGVVSTRPLEETEQRVNIKTLEYHKIDFAGLTRVTSFSDRSAVFDCQQIVYQQRALFESRILDIDAAVSR